MPGQYNLSKAAEKASLTVHQVRNYLAFGLVECWGRSAAGHRQLDDLCVRRLRFIGAAMRAGLNIADVRPILDAVDDASSVGFKEARQRILESVRTRRNAINDLSRQLRHPCDQPELYGRKE